MGTNRFNKNITKSVGGRSSDYDIFLREKEILARVSVGKTVFRKWVASGHIRKFRLPDGKICLYNWGEIKRWIESFHVNKSPFIGQPITRLEV